MCGITCRIAFTSGPAGQGELAAKEQARKLKAELDASLDLIIHRGPDARGSWISDDARVGLAHCRLAINDLRPSASQPLHSSDGKVHAVVNGEIYDFERLRDSLVERFQHRFQTNSDSEVALALYEHYGLDFLQHLRGEFAVCIYDERRQIFLAARDRYGIKPLFWTFDEHGRLLVAAEAKAFIGFGWKAEWDVASIVEGGWNFDDRTLFKGVKKVLPGQCLIWNGELRFESYWDITFPDKSQREVRTEAEMIAGVRERMLDAIRLRLRADVPVGVYLSGGIDSSVIAGMVTHLIQQGEKIGDSTNDRVCCFSIAFDKASGLDESDIAERTAKWLNVRYLKKLMSEDELARRFEDATWHCEHHNHDLNFVGKFALSELPREHGYKVVLTGEGADEIFAGYPMYLPDFLQEPDLAWTSHLPDAKRKQQWQEREEAAAKYYASVGADGSNRGPCTASEMLGNITIPASMCAFQFDAFAPWTKGQDPRMTIARGINEHARGEMLRWHPLHAALYTWTKGHLANNFLSCLGDRTEMAHSIEARPPFLDHVLTEYVNALPPSLKIQYDASTDEFIEKWILREAARPFITDEIYRRRKHPYTAPTTWPRDGPMHQLFRRLLSEANVRGLGFIDWERAKHMVANAFENNDAKAMRGCFLVGEWVVLSQRFKIPTATPVGKLNGLSTLTT